MAKSIRGKYWFGQPNITRLVHTLNCETLLTLGAPSDVKDYTMVVGIGHVRKIEKGKDFDIVGMDFGKGFVREIIVKNNHARRQIYTLKRGQYGWFLGLMKHYIDQETKQARVQLYAKAFQGWYVPKNMDITKMEPEDITIEEMQDQKENQMNIIDELIGGKK